MKKTEKVLQQIPPSLLSSANIQLSSILPDSSPQSNSNFYSGSPPLNSRNIGSWNTKNSSTPSYSQDKVKPDFTYLLSKEIRKLKTELEKLREEVSCVKRQTQSLSDKISHKNYPYEPRSENCSSSSIPSHRGNEDNSKPSSDQGVYLSRVVRPQNVAIVIFDLSKKPAIVLSANDTFCELLGYPMEEVVGASWHKFVHPDYLERALDIISNKKNQNGDLVFEQVYVRKNGSLFQTLDTHMIFYTPNGTPLSDIVYISTHPNPSVKLPDPESRSLYQKSPPSTHTEESSSPPTPSSLKRFLPNSEYEYNEYSKRRMVLPMDQDNSRLFEGYSQSNQPRKMILSPNLDNTQVPTPQQTHPQKPKIVEVDSPSPPITINNHNQQSIGDWIHLDSEINPDFSPRRLSVSSDIDDILNHPKSPSPTNSPVPNNESDLGMNFNTPIDGVWVYSPYPSPGSSISGIPNSPIFEGSSPDSNSLNRSSEFDIL